MICAAVRGLTARITRAAMVRLSQASSGILPSVIPRHRIERMVATMLTAVPMLPKPEIKSAMAQ